MRKKIMIAVDPSVHSRNAMIYAAQLSEAVTGIDIDLFHAQPMISSYLLEEARKHPKAQAELRQICDQNQNTARDLLEACREQMAVWCKEAAINTITNPLKHGVAKDITLTAEEGVYDAVVVGRRGIAGLQEKIMGSVTANLLSSAREIPVWVVDGQAPPGGVLIAVDGSLGSLRAVDHAAHMLSGSRGIDIGIVNIEPKLADFSEVAPEPAGSREPAGTDEASNEKILSDFVPRAHGILERAGIDREAVKFLSVKRKLFTRRAILDLFRQDGYSTLVVSKTGSAQSSNMSGVASYLTQKASNGAVWVVP
jgi:nucleotide-binding universal stress UspA family protein